MERHEFQAETKQLLDLMIHSIYSNKDIFLRELISNSSDALDKLRHEALSNEALKEFVTHPEIRIEIDKDNHTLTVSDNGIGMSRDEVVDYVGTIAKSGTREFLQKLRDQQKQSDGQLIGQFGVGLYASFMVASQIDLVTRRAGESTATRWSSCGDGTYTLEETSRDIPGTSITLHLKPADSEEDVVDYTTEWKLREIVRKYSDYVSYPIVMKTEHREIERDEKGLPVEGAEEKVTWQDETLNSMKAIWLRADNEVSDEEYNEFYKHISHDWQEPLRRIRFKAEGTLEFRGLLFIPSHAPFEMFMRDRQRGIQLYIKRVFIMSDCEELIPEYLRFVKGVVDSEDLSLNISREILQQSRHIRVIHKHIVNKVLDDLRQMKENDRESYLKFWQEFGQTLKEGLYHDHDNREKILDLALFETSKSDGQFISLREYCDRMVEGQKKIYFIAGRSKENLVSAPQLEAYTDKGYEVLYLADPVDHLWTGWVTNYQEHPLQSVSEGDAEIEDAQEDSADAKAEKEKQSEELQPLLEQLQSCLEEHVKEVRISHRLTRSPACLVGEKGDMTPLMEELMRASGQEVPVVKRILELNPEHPVVRKLLNLKQSDGDVDWSTYAVVLYGQALLAEGQVPPNPGEFADKLAGLMASALN